MDEAAQSVRCWRISRQDKVRSAKAVGEGQLDSACQRVRNPRRAEVMPLTSMIPVVTEAIEPVQDAGSAYADSILYRDLESGAVELHTRGCVMEGGAVDRLTAISKEVVAAENVCSQAFTSFGANKSLIALAACRK